MWERGALEGIDISLIVIKMASLYYNEENDDFAEEFAKLKENFISQYSVRKILESVSVSDEEAEEFYKANPNLFVTPAQIRASHILVAEEEKAAELYAKIQSGESFEELAIDNSTCPSGVNGGDLNFFSGLSICLPNQCRLYNESRRQRW